MSTKNLFAVAIALAAELCASSGSALLTMCIHEDGTVRYEPSMALCCRQNQKGQGECCSHEEANPFEGEQATSEDTCQDYGVVFSQFPTPKSSIKQILLDSSGVCELLPVVAPNLRTLGVESSIGLGACGPPGHHTLLDLSTVILRI